MEEIAAQLGLRRVGWIFTDLVTLAGKLAPLYLLIDTGTEGCNWRHTNDDKLALLWGEAQKKIAYSYHKVT